MTTLTITRPLGVAIRKLQAGWRINKIKAHRWSEHVYLWIAQEGAEPGNYIDNALLAELRTHKLIVGGPVDRLERHFNHSRRVFRATEKCRNFKLPPEQFWIEV